MLSVGDQNSLIPTLESENGGNVHSKVEPNGSGKSESRTEETAVEEDLREQKLALEVKIVVSSMKTPKMANGMK
jgi:hypothetical protein